MSKPREGYTSFCVPYTSFLIDLIDCQLAEQYTVSNNILYGDTLSYFYFYFNVLHFGLMFPQDFNTVCVCLFTKAVHFTIDKNIIRIIFYG